MHIVVVAAGEMRQPNYWQQRLKTAARIICADGGLSHCQKLGVEPHLLMGDLDSYSGAPPPNLKVIRLDIDKDLSDSEAAITHAFTMGATSVELLGGTSGSRLDHTLANFKLLSRYPDKLSMTDGDFTAQVITQQHSFAAQPDEICTLLPSGDQAVCLSTQGLHFALDHGWLQPSSQGLSNRPTAAHVQINMHHGAVLLLRHFSPHASV